MNYYKLYLHDLNELDCQLVLEHDDLEKLCDIRENLQRITNRYEGLFLGIETTVDLEGDIHEEN